MNTSSSAPPAPLPALLLLAAALYTALALGLPAPFGSAQTVMHWAFVAAVTFAWLLAVQVWWQRRTDVIAWLAAVMSVHALGKLWNLDFGLIEAIHNHSPARLALDTLFFVLAGVALTKEVGWLRETGRWPGQLALLDTLMIAVIAGMGVWMLGLDALVAGASEQPLLVGLLLAYGAAQILIISLSVMMLLRGIHSRVLGFVTAGLLLFGFADLYAVLTGDGAHERWLSLLWIWGMTLLALGMEQVVRTRLPPPAAAGLPPALRRTLRRLPYTAVLVCCALLLAGAFSGPQRQLGITVGTVAVFGLVMLRQAKIAQVNRQMHAQLEASRRDLEHLAYHDVLTGLPNRAAFTRFFATSLGPDKPYAIFSLDLNGFKNINDTYGHAVGDQMLRHAAQQLERAVAAPGQIFRWGGDEFVIVVPGVQRGAEAEALARFIAVNIQAPMLYQGQQLSVGTSVGYALGRGNQAHEALLGLADHDMYSVKARSGRRR
ncbi:MAG: GGDEF domain-containing protein [Deinococcus sp.]|nr:GGDEF domain-containing protein [Deinococcus sp.]